MRLVVYSNFRKRGGMNTLVIENKSYVVIPAESYEALQRKAALNTKPEKLLSLEQAKVRTRKLIQKWAEEKSA